MNKSIIVLVSALILLLLVSTGASAAASIAGCTEFGGYPWVQGGCVNANDLNQGLDLSVGATPPRNDFGQGAHQGHNWLDTSTVPAATWRMCVNPNGCATSYITGDWVNWATVNLSTRATSLVTGPSTSNVGDIPVFGTTTGNELIDTEVMRITEGTNNVLIGTTTDCGQKLCSNGVVTALNAKVLGATGNNSTNDGPALATALASCSATQPLYLPPGQYKTQLKLYAPAQCKFYGDLNFTYLVGDTPNAEIFADNTSGNFSPSAFIGVISGTTLTASAVTGQLAIGDLLAGSGISGGTRITALGTGTGGAGTYTVNNSQSISSEAMTSVGAVLTIGEATSLRGIGLHGDNVAGHADGLEINGKFVQLDNILVFSGGTYSVNCPEGAPFYQGTQIRNSLVAYSQGAGYFNGCADSNAFGNYFYSNQGNGVDGFSEKTTYIGNTMEGNIGYGMALYDSSQWVIVGNHIVDNYGPGLKLDGTAGAGLFNNLVLNGNDFRDNGRAQGSQQDCHIFVAGTITNLNASGNTYDTNLGAPGNTAAPNYIFCGSVGSSPALVNSTIGDILPAQAIGVYESAVIQQAVQPATTNALGMARGIVTPTPTAITTAGAAQASGGTTLVALTSGTSVAAGQVFSDTTHPTYSVLGNQVASVTSYTAPVTFVTTSSSASGQAVINSTNVSTSTVQTGMQCLDISAGHTAYIGAGNVLTGAVNGTSATLTTNIVTTIPLGDSITCWPVATLTAATTTAIGGGDALNFVANATTVSASSAGVNQGDQAIYGNLNVGGAISSGQINVNVGAASGGVTVTSTNQARVDLIQTGGTDFLVYSNGNILNFYDNSHSKMMEQLAASTGNATFGGTLSAANIQPSGSTAPTVGMALPAAGRLGLYGTTWENFSGATDTLDYGVSTASVLTASVPTTINSATFKVTTLAAAAAIDTVCYSTVTGLFTEEPTGTTCTVSDERLKSPLQPISDRHSLDIIMGSKPSSFYFLPGTPNDDGNYHFGFGAQTLAKVAPELTLTDDDGVPNRIKYGELTPITWAAIQEQQRQIETLKLLALWIILFCGLMYVRQRTHVAPSGG